MGEAVRSPVLDRLNENQIEYGGPRGDEITLNCPFCPDHGYSNQKQKLYFNVIKRRGFCFKCGESVGSWKLYKKLGIGDEEEEQPIPSKLETAKPKPELVSVQPPADSVRLVRDDQSEVARMAAYFLITTRGFTWEDIDSFEVRFCFKGPLAGSVVFPIKDDEGRVRSWQSRRFMTAKRKADNPPDGPGRSDLLFNLDRCIGKKHIVIVEGPFDAVILQRHLSDTNYGPVALLGHSISRIQAALIRSLDPKSVTVMLDPDVPEAQPEVAFTLTAAGIRTVFLAAATKDPDEYDRQGVIELLQFAKPYARCL